jgi:hypothetical protein
MELSKMNVAIAEIAKARGLAQPWQAYADPTVRQEFVPAWLDALGANLDDNQIGAVKQHVRDVAAADTGGQALSYLDSIRERLSGNLEEEKFLGTLLRPDQQQAYDASVGDDPFFGTNLNRSVDQSATTDGLVEAVLGEWKKSFDLSPRALAGAQAIAEKYVQEAIAVAPVDPSLDTAARRAAATNRQVQEIALQERMESELANVSVLTDDERARVKQGSRSVLDLRLQPKK